jgi:hypothetical protein
LIGIEYLYSQTNKVLEDLYEDPDADNLEDAMLEDENESLDEGFEDTDPTLPPIPFTPTKVKLPAKKHAPKPALPIHDEDSIPSK